MKFRNKNSSEHVEKFIEKFMSNMAIADVGRQINSHAIIDKFFHAFFDQLDTDKNFYFVENSNARSFSTYKILEPGPKHIETRYETNQDLRSDYSLSMYDIGNENKIETIMHYLGSNIGHNIKLQCLGDSYVTSEPMIRIMMEPSGNNTISFNLKFNILPMLRVYEDRSYDAREYGSQFIHNYSPPSNTIHP